MSQLHLSVRRCLAAALFAATLVAPLAAQAGPNGLNIVVTNLTNGTVSYSSSDPLLQKAYAAFDVNIKNNSSSGTNHAYFRIGAISTAQTTSNYPIFVAESLYSGASGSCVVDNTIGAPSGSAILCDLSFAPAGSAGDSLAFRLRVQTPQAPTGFSGTDTLVVEYLLQAGQGQPNPSTDVYTFTDPTTLVPQTQREVHSWVEAGQPLSLYVDQGRTKVIPPRPELVGLTQTVNKQSCSPQVKKCLLSDLTIVNTSQVTEQFYGANWLSTDPGWLQIALTRDASTINKKANINNATVRYSKDGVNYMDVYNCSDLTPPVPQSSVGGLDAQGYPITNVGANTHCIVGRIVNGDGSWTINLIASENGKTSW